MTTYAAEPGTRLGGRYRLEDRIAAGAGWAAWKAIDETLARAVTVFTFADGFPRIGDVVTAARAASRLTDPRLAQVFDVEDAPDRAYVVMEWAAGETLGDLLTHGPLESARAGRMIAEAAAALSVAHAAGVAHMCLSPGSLRWSPTGEVKVVGLGLDAALSGTTADDPVLADTVGLGRLLYAALTGYWPGSHDPVLPPAPVAGGQPCSPRQVAAGIPAALSAIACGAIGLRTRDAGPQVTTPDQLARALLAAVPPAPPPPAAAPGGWFGPRAEHPRHQADGYLASRQAGPRYGGVRQRRRDDDRRADPDPPDSSWPAERASSGFVPVIAADVQAETDGPMTGRSWPADQFAPSDWADEFADDPAQVAGSAGRQRRRRRSPGRVPVVVLVVTGTIALAAIAAFTLLRGGGSGTPPRHPTGSPSSSGASAAVLQPVAASGFDPLTSVKADRHNENTQYARYAIDNNPSSAWQSQWYATATFGGLKAGSGLLIDLGRTARLSSVTVTFGPLPGARVEVLLGSSAARSTANLDSMTTIGAQANPTGTVTFTITSQASGRYLVIWFTRLPPLSAHSTHKFMASVYNVTVKGIA